MESTRPKKVDENLKIIKNVIEDFEKRKEARKSYELQWQLNIDFLNGRQNNYVTNFASVGSHARRFHWQRNEVFNHIAPMIESRLARLVNQDERFSVVPMGDTEKDLVDADKCEKIISSAFKKVNMKSLTEQANMWSEMTGTAFYKVVWNNDGGRIVGEIDGQNLHEGDVNVVVASPFEIYPDSLTAPDVQNLSSLIHARPYTTDLVKKIWGVDVKGKDVDVHDFNRSNPDGSVLRDAVMVIERYKDGELTIVAGDKLLYHGEYFGIPFIRQTCEAVPGCFFGRSVIERAIPIQRAYNNVKNRKIEFMNRLACGVLTVEENTIDLEALENDGLAPGTIIVHRAGTPPPKFLDGSTVPSELDAEEERLLGEMSSITAGNLISRAGPNISGVALGMMVEQDRLRIMRAITSGQNARTLVAKRVLQLYRTYATHGRLERLTRGRKVEMFTWSREDVTSDDVEMLCEGCSE